MPDDSDALRELLNHSDASKPHLFEHFMYFPDSEAGEQVAAVLRRRGFEVVSEIGPLGDNWSVLVKHSIIPQIEIIRAVRAELELLAEKHGGNYDGWEAETVKVLS